MPITTDKLSVSIVMCCRNEVNNIPIVLKRVIETRDILRDRDVEVIIVDGDSHDGTWEELTEVFSLPRYFTVIQQGLPLGFGNGMRQGLKKAGGDVIVTIDADLNFDQRDIPKLLNSLTDDVDIVISNPWDRSVSNHDFPWYRAIFSITMTFLYRLACFPLGQDIHSFTAIFRVFRREVLRNTMPRAGGFLFSAEFITRCVLRGYRICEINIPCHFRGGGHTKLPFMQTILSHLKYIIKVRLRLV